MSIGFARVSILGVLANDDVIDFARLPNLFQLAVNLVLNARVEFHRPDVRVQIELLSIENYLREPGQLWLWIRLAWLGENRFAVNLMSDCAQQNRVGRFALFKRTFRPFDLVLRVVMSAARNLFDLKIDLKQLTGRAQNVQSAAIRLQARCRHRAALRCNRIASP